MVEDRLAAHLDRSAAVDRHLAAGDVVADERVGGAHEREPGAFVAGAAAVEPEGVSRRAEQVDERPLCVIEAVQALDRELVFRSTVGGPLAPRPARHDAGRVAAAPPCAGAAVPRQVAEVGEQAGAVLGADRLGMELDAPLRPLAVGDGHDHPVLRPGDRLEPAGEVGRHAERVVADSLEPLGDAGEQGRLVVVHGAQPAVHHLGRVDHRGSGRAGQPLMAEADAQHRDRRGGQYVGADAEVGAVVGPSGTGRDDDVVELEVRQLIPARAVVANHDGVLAVGLRQELEEVERERVVVVQQQRLRAHAGDARTWSLAAGGSVRWLRV